MIVVHDEPFALHLSQTYLTSMGLVPFHEPGIARSVDPSTMLPDTPGRLELEAAT